MTGKAAEDLFSEGTSGSKINYICSYLYILISILKQQMNNLDKLIIEQLKIKKETFTIFSFYISLKIYE